MPDNELLNEYVKVLRAALKRDPGEISEDTPLDGLVANSIELLEVIMAAEEHFDITIDADAMDLHSLQTVGDMLALARAHGVGSQENG